MDGVLPAAPARPVAAHGGVAARQPEGEAAGDGRAPQALRRLRVGADGRAAQLRLHRFQKGQSDGVGVGGGQTGEAVEHQRRAQLQFPARHGLREKARLRTGLFRRAGGQHVVSAHQQAVFAGGYVIGLEVGVGVVLGDAGADVHRGAAACAHGGKVDVAGKGADVQPQIADAAQRFKGLVGHKDHAPSLHGMAGPPRACIAPRELRAEKMRPRKQMVKPGEGCACAARKSAVP